MSTARLNLFARFSALSMIALPVAAACGERKPAASPLPAGETMAVAPPPASSVATAPPSPARSEAASAAPSPASTAAAPVSSVSVLTTDVGIIQKLFDDTTRASGATLKAEGAAGADPLARGLRDFARTAAASMEADGPLGTSALKEKQTVQMDVTLQPGKCYAIVGYSNQVKDLDLYLLLPPGILSGQDTTDDNTPVIGGSRQAMCPIATTPIAYKLGIVADKGAGDVAVQLYSKAH